MTEEKQLQIYRKECEEFILSIHGVDMSKQAIDEDHLYNSMIQGIKPIDVAIEFDINNCIEED